MTLQCREISPKAGFVNESLSFDFMSGNAAPHIRISFYIFQVVIIHNSQAAAPQSFGHGFRHFSFRFHYFGLHFLGIGFHFLFLSHSHGPSFFRSCLGDLLVSFRLIRLQLGAYISAYIHIGNINRKNFKSSA